MEIHSSGGEYTKFSSNHGRPLVQFLHTCYMKMRQKLSKKLDHRCARASLQEAWQDGRTGLLLMKSPQPGVASLPGSKSTQIEIPKKILLESQWAMQILDQPI